MLIAGRNLEVLWIGPPRSARRRVIVFLHEGLGSVSLWRDFPAALCERTGCSGLVYSRWGHGQSDALEGPRGVDFMHEEALTVLPALLKRFEVRRPILFGHSDGGSIAVIYAGGAGRNVAGLILEAPHMFVEDLTIASIARTRKRYSTTNFRRRLGRHHANLDPLFRAWTDVWLSPAFRAWNLEQYARSVRAPMLLLQGDEDEYGTSKQLEAIAAATGGPSRLVMLKDCGHTPHVDQRARVERLAARFIKSLK